MQWTRILALVMAAAMAITVVTIGGTMVGAQPKGTIVHWQHFHEGRATALKALIPAFQGENPGITVTTDLPPYEQYFDKLLAALAAGTGPDVFQVPMEMAEQLINGGLIAPVPESVTTTAEIERRYLRWTTARFKRGGKYYGLPTDVQHLVLYINNDLAKEAGLDPSKPPQTWDELIAQARKATKRDAQGNIVQAGLDTRYKWAVYTTLLYQFVEGPVIDASAKRATYDSAQGIAAWKVVEQLLRGPSAVDSPRFLPGQRKFELKRAVFYINHPVARSVIARIGPDIKYTIAPVPAIKGKRPVAPGHHWAYVVNARSKNKEAAWLWVKYLASERAQRTWMRVAGDLPSLVDLLPTEPDPAVRESVKLVRPVDYVGVCDPVRNDLFDAIALTNRPVQELVREAVQKENTCVQQALR